MPHFPHQGNRLQPTKALLDSLPLFLTDRISGMPRRPFINRAASAARAVLRYMWCDVQVPAFRYEVPRV